MSWRDSWCWFIINALLRVRKCYIFNISLVCLLLRFIGNTENTDESEMRHFKNVCKVQLIRSWLGLRCKRFWADDQLDRIVFEAPWTRPSTVIYIFIFLIKSSSFFLLPSFGESLPGNFLAWRLKPSFKKTSSRVLRLSSYSSVYIKLCMMMRDDTAGPRSVLGEGNKAKEMLCRYSVCVF